MKNFLTIRNIVGFIFVLFGVLGLLAAFSLTNDQLALLEDPEVEFSCSVNQVINCKSVMKTWQAEVFGFPNMVLGLAGYGAVLALGVVFLGTKKFKGSFMPLAIFLGAFGAFGFSYWLVYESIYDIGSLCPWCLLSALSATFVFFGSIVNVLYGSENVLSEDLQKFVQEKNFKVILTCLAILWFVIWLGLIYLEFGEQLFS